MTEILMAIAMTVTVSAGNGTQQGDLAIWQEFVRLLKTDTLTVDRVRSIHPLTPAFQLAALRSYTKDAVWEEWEQAPEIVRNGNLVTFIITLGRARNSPWVYTFNFIVEGDRWYFRFLEGIHLRLDKLPAPPTPGAAFPDVPDQQKTWMRQETYWSQMVRWHNVMVGLKGKAYALDMYRDGAGYALAATTWVPFYPTPRAFILYLCWDLARIQGDTVTLERLADDQAAVRIDNSVYFSLYLQTSHLKSQISLEDYSAIFETIWQDRARAAGWTLTIDRQGRQVYLRFSRSL